MSDHLTKEDVARLLADPSPDQRAVLAGKMALQFDNQELTAAERSLAEDIVRVMARDAMARVRQSLAENLKTSPNLPRDVALTLARDVEAVAVPILSMSKSLSEADLIELVRAGSPAKQSAIAGRPEVPERLADELVKVGDEGAVAVLVANEGAALGEAGLNRVVDRFGASERVQGPLVHRSRLPLTVAERLVTMISENLQDYLVTHHELPADTASDLILKSRERATVSLFTGESDEEALGLYGRPHLFRGGTGPSGGGAGPQCPPADPRWRPSRRQGPVYQGGPARRPIAGGAYRRRRGPRDPVRRRRP
jgi:uncharacterized protein (DUF2336 family)